MNTWIKDIVIGLVETYKTNDIYILCDCLNIEIVRIYDNNKLDSYFVRNNDGDEFIFIQQDIDPKKERYLLAHELGHAILHTNHNVAFYCMKSFNRGKLEIQADLFASELLLSDIIMADYLVEGSTIESVAIELEVTENILKIKLGRSC